MNILFKYPSRGRPDRFFQGLTSIINHLGAKDKYHINCTLETDDVTMNNERVIQKILQVPHTSISWGASKSKIDAFNRDMPKYDWDVCIGMSDDMRFIVYGFDQLIRDGFQINAPDTDALMHYPDNDAKYAVPVLYMAGRKYYDRDGYIYHPSYKSLFCDNESAEVAKLRGKYHYLGIQLVNHLNPAYGHLERDEMFNRQQDDWNVDEENFYQRQLNKFYLNPDEIITKAA